jgi:hypothetical protein
VDDSPDKNPPSNLNSASHPEGSEKTNLQPVHPMRSLTRLVIGGVEVGIEELFRLLQVWEEEASLNNRADPDAGGSGSALKETSNTTLRHALIGLIFETQEHLEREARILGQVGMVINRWAGPWAEPLHTLFHSRYTAPVRSRFERLVARGEAEAARWVEIGRAEDAHSRKLAQVAFDKTIDEYIEYLTSNPEVQELVQQQSTGLANEVIEEVRERTVSADNLLEGIARSLLHRVPRAALPEPPSSLRKIAAPRSARNKEGSK